MTVRHDNNELAASSGVIEKTLGCTRAKLFYIIQLEIKSANLDYTEVQLNPEIQIKVLYHEINIQESQKLSQFELQIATKVCSENQAPFAGVRGVEVESPQSIYTSETKLIKFQSPHHLSTA